jgi:hypothetical protein
MQEMRMETIVRENKPVDLGDRVVKSENKLFCLHSPTDV